MEGTRTNDGPADPGRMIAELLDQAIARYFQARETERRFSESIPDRDDGDGDGPDPWEDAIEEAVDALDLAEEALALRLRAYRKAVLGTRDDAWPFAVLIGDRTYVVPGPSADVEPGRRVVVLDAARILRREGGRP